MNAQIIITPTYHELPDGGGRLSAFVEQDELFYEVADAKLTSHGDAIATALFLSMLRNGASVKINAPVDRTLLANFDKISSITKRWWGFEPGGFDVSTVVDGRMTNSAKAMFFTGGVDSFLTLRSLHNRLKGLIAVHGFDIWLHDPERFVEASQNIATVANTLGLVAFYPRTSLRSVQFFEGKPLWGISHLAALSSVAHLFSYRFSHVYVASSDVPPPWGSYAPLDRLWSSGAVTIENHGWRMTRQQKVKAIADWPLVHKFLKVCWENRAKSLNCGVCEKCVRTQAQFLTTGHLDKVETFPPGSVIDRIDELPRGKFPNQWLDISNATSDVSVRGAIQRLMERTPQKATDHNIYWSWKDDLRFWSSDLLRRLPSAPARDMAKVLAQNG
jgi:hypothetical protein